MQNNAIRILTSYLHIHNDCNLVDQDEIYSVIYAWAEPPHTLDITWTCGQYIESHGNMEATQKFTQLSRVVLISCILDYDYLQLKQFVNG